MKTVLDYARMYLEAHRHEMSKEEVKNCECAIGIAEHKKWLEERQK